MTAGFARRWTRVVLVKAATLALWVALGLCAWAEQNGEVGHE